VGSALLVRCHLLHKRLQLWDCLRCHICGNVSCKFTGGTIVVVIAEYDIKDKVERIILDGVVDAENYYACKSLIL
jgi:hypothetical protein